MPSKAEEARQWHRDRVATKIANDGWVWDCTDLLISEYVDGTGDNKAIEVTNLDSEKKELAKYRIGIFTDGATVPVIIPLSHPDVYIQGQESYVIGNPLAGQSVLDAAAVKGQLDATLSFNGDDAVVLLKQVDFAPYGWQIIDKIGEIDLNYPAGIGWVVSGSGLTKGSTLQRKWLCKRGRPDWSICQNEWEVKKKDTTKDLGKHGSVCSAAVTTDLHLSIENLHLSCASDSMIFDVMVSANAPTFLDVAGAVIHYPVTGYGASVISNGTATVTLGPDFPTSTYFAAQSLAYDDAVDTMVIQLNPDWGLTSWNRTEVNSTPKVLFHVAMHIANCEALGDLELVDFPSELFTHTPTPGEDAITGDFDFYDNVHAGDIEEFFTCEAIIQSMTPVAFGGVWNKVQLRGHSFGCTTDVLELRHVDSDTYPLWPPHYVQIDDIDLLTWTDTLIEFHCPSSSFQYQGFWQAGTGPVNIFSSHGYFDESPADLIIPWACDNVKDVSGPTKYRLLPADINGSGGYTWLIQSDVDSLYPKCRGAFAKAAHDWTCLTTINWEVDPNPHSVTYDPPGDGISSLTIDYGENGSSFFGFYRAGYQICHDTLTPGEQPTAKITEMDIKIPVDVTGSITPGAYMWFDTLLNNKPATAVDMYGVLKHELGHAHTQIHTTEATDLLYWGTQVADSVPAADRVDFGWFNQDMGLDVVFTSEATTWGSTCTGTLTHQPQETSELDCTNPIWARIEILEARKRETLVLYPNPANHHFAVSGFAVDRGPLNWQIFALDGKMVARSRTAQRLDAAQELRIPIDNLSPGLYFVSVTGREFSSTLKLVVGQ